MSKKDNNSIEASSSPILEWTGERYVPSVSGQIRYEHVHRYAICKELVNDKRVLDIACGEGYGSAFLANLAKSVIGVDIDTTAVKHARKKYTAIPNLVFKQGSVDKIPIKDSSIDAVVSFETLEHVDCHREMLAEIMRVLKDEGVLIISTPDKATYALFSDGYNEYHVKELLTEEFKQLLIPLFKNVSFYGQRLATGSLFFPFEQANTIPYYDAWASDEDSAIQASTAILDSPVYNIAVCSNTDIDALKPSIYLDSQVDLFSQQIEYIKWAQTVDHELSKAGEELNKAGEEARRLNQVLEESQKLAVHSDTEREALTMQLNQVHNSTSWRISFPIRFFGRVAKRLKEKYARMAALVIWFILRGIYKLLPLPFDKRLVLRNWIFRQFPRLSRNASTYKAWKLASNGKFSSKGNLGLTNSARYEFLLKEKTKLPDQKESQTLSTYFLDNATVQPKASIIIPVYGQIGYTLMCLRSISLMMSDVSFEVIIVDDKSRDNTLQVLSNIEGLKLIENAENMGFIKSCNAGAKVARGEFLVFLNNDTEVVEGWLDALISTFECVSDAGLVGSKLVYPDGRLQEAGAIIWSDGSAWNYGRDNDPDHPEFSYLREVDYCSGASLAISRELFVQLGCFDELYLPAYGEDSDLAFKVRAQNKKVYYQPLSEVVHYEGITSGTDISSGVKAYQVENTKKLYQRWKAEIEKLNNPGENIEGAKDKDRIGRILVLDHCTPTPDMDAGSITALNIMRLLTAHGYQVTFIAEDNFLYMPDYTVDLQRMGIEALYSPYFMSVKQYLKDFGSQFDGVLLFRPLVAERHLDDIEHYCRRAKILYHASDLHFLRNQREDQLKKTKRKPKFTTGSRDRELGYFKRADVSIVHSSVEAEILSKEYEIDNLHIFPWAIDIPGTTKTYDERKDICFIGSYQHPPNEDAAIHFIKEIFPILRERIPGVKFYAIGTNPTAELKALETDQIIVTDYIQDLKSKLDEMRVAVAPLRYGAGIKGKIGTTLSVGLPCVGTAIAAEGMELEDKKNFLLANGAEEFSDKVYKLYNDNFIWSEISRNSINFADTKYGMRGGYDTVGRILKSIDMPSAANVNIHIRSTKTAGG